MFEKVAEKVIENLTLTVIVIGVVFFLLATGALSKFGLGIEKPGWPIPVAIFGAILIGIGIGIFWHEKIKSYRIAGTVPETKTPVDKYRVKIEGKYFAEGVPTEEIDITYLSEGLYRMKHKIWEGVGLFDGEFYYGIYKYNDKAREDRGKMGAHKGKLREGGGALNLHLIELGHKSDYIEYEYIWVKDIDG